MTPASKISRSTVARTAAALAGVAALAVGMSACGSDAQDTAATTKSTPTVAKREAGLGLLPVQLKVVNATGASVDFIDCTANCGAASKLEDGGTAILFSDDNPNGNSVSGSIGYPNEASRKVKFFANNPAFGEPYFDMDLGGPGSLNRTYLDEGETQASQTGTDTSNPAIYRFSLSRGGDTAYKMMTLTLLP